MPVYRRAPGGKIGIGRRECTHRYKVRPLYQKARELVGYPKGRPPVGIVQMYLGITRDEAHRMRDARVLYVQNNYPLIDKGWRRRDCMVWHKLHYPRRTLTSSSCIGCPYHNAKHWHDIKHNRPDEWRDAVDADRRVRTVGAGDVKHYLHRSATPLEHAITDEPLPDDLQEDLFSDECEGMCGL